MLGRLRTWWDHNWVPLLIMLVIIAVTVGAGVASGLSSGGGCS